MTALLVATNVPEWSLAIMAGAGVTLGSWALKVLVDIRAEIAGMRSTVDAALTRLDHHEDRLDGHDNTLANHRGRISALEAHQ